MAANRPGKAFFPESGRFGRRQVPADSVATSASPSPFSPPRALPPSREYNPTLDFGQRPPQPQTHYPPEASSAAKLAAGSSLRPHRPGDHLEDRTGVADPSRPSGTRGEPPFAGDDRRCPASVRAKEEEGEIDQSNVTSGPGGPIVNETRAVHAG